MKVSCEHRYGPDCSENFIAARVQTSHNLPPSCCKIPLAFSIVAEHRSDSLFARYHKRPIDLKMATALNCGVLACGIKIPDDKLNSIKGKRVSCASYNEDTCTQCRAPIIPAISAK